MGGYPYPLPGVNREVQAAFGLAPTRVGRVTCPVVRRLAPAHQARPGPPSRLGIERLHRGFGHQEAPQADGEEEAPQAAQAHAHPASPRRQVARACVLVAAERVVLVTGVSRDLGARFARALAADETSPSSGSTSPRHGTISVQAAFVRADIRNPVIAKVIATREVDTVVHMAMVATPGSAGGRSSMKEINVIGTMQLLAACQKADELHEAGRAELGLGLRRVAARPGQVHRGDVAAGPAAYRLRQGLGRDRELRARARPAAGPTSWSPRCGWRT